MTHLRSQYLFTFILFFWIMIWVYNCEDIGRVGGRNTCVFTCTHQSANECAQVCLAAQIWVYFSVNRKIRLHLSLVSLGPSALREMQT